MVPIHHTWLWFPERAGLFSGIVIAGFGAGPLIWDNLATHTINPNDEKVLENGFYPDDVNARFVLMIRTLVLCWACIAIFAAITIFQGPIKEEDERLSSRITINTDEEEDLHRSELESGPTIEEHGLLGERASIVRKDRKSRKDRSLLV